MRNSAPCGNITAIRPESSAIDATHLLDPGVVAVARRRQAEGRAAPRVRLPHLAAPLRERERRVSDDAVERRQGARRVRERGVPERVVLLAPEVLDAVQHEVHERDGRRGEVLLLAEDAPEEGPRVAAGPLRVLDRAEQHTAGAAGRVVDALALLRIEQVDHHPHHATGRVELARLLAPRDVGEPTDQVLVGVTEDVGSDSRVAQRHTGQALDEVLEQLVAEHLAVVPVGRAKDARQGLRIGPPRSLASPPPARHQRSLASRERPASGSRPAACATR